MSDRNPYEELGLTEDASFEAIQEAKNILMQQYSGDRQRLQIIETAYDDILMDRLRMRQEGKIKVPERIRFPERIAPPAPSPISTLPSKTPSWLQGLLDTPSRNDILWPSGVFIALSGIIIYPATAVSLVQLALAVGVGSTLYFLNRKEGKFGRSLGLTVVGLIAGLMLGGLLSSLPMFSMALMPEKFITVITFIVLWLISSFLK